MIDCLILLVTSRFSFVGVMLCGVEVEDAVPIVAGGIITAG